MITVRTPMMKELPKIIRNKEGEVMLTEANKGSIIMIIAIANTTNRRGTRNICPRTKRKRGKQDKKSTWRRKIRNLNNRLTNNNPLSFNRLNKFKKLRLKKYLTFFFECVVLAIQIYHSNNLRQNPNQRQFQELQILLNH